MGAADRKFPHREDDQTTQFKESGKPPSRTCPAETSFALAFQVGISV
jgi:hypothetical protein